MTLTSCYKNPPYCCNEAEMALVKQAEVEFDELIAYSPKVQNFDYVSLWIPYEKLNKTR